MRLLFALLFALSLPALADQSDQSVESGGYVLHYATMNTSALTPEIAQQLGVKRSGRLALLLVNAQRRNADGNTTPVAARGNGVTRTLMGEQRPLALRAAGQDLIATIDLGNEFEVFKFELQVTPEGASAPLALRFEQQLFRD